MKKEPIGVVAAYEIDKDATVFIDTVEFLDEHEEKLIVDLYKNGKQKEAKDKWGFEPALEVGDEFYFRSSCSGCEYLRGEYCYALMEEVDIDSGCENHTNIRFKNAVSREIKRVQDMSYQQKQSFCSSWVDREHHKRVKFSTWFNERFGDGAYERNDYVFIYTFKDTE